MGDGPPPIEPKVVKFESCFGNTNNKSLRRLCETSTIPLIKQNPSVSWDIHTDCSIFAHKIICGDVLHSYVHILLSSIHIICMARL